MQGRYDAQIDEGNDNDSHVVMIKMVGRGKRVLDLGCWNGDMGAHLRSRNLEVVGLEKDAEAAAVAARRLDSVVTGDVDELDLSEIFGTERFDVIVAGDVLEHLTDPASTLRRLRPLLAHGGSIVASIPNVAHGSVRLNLLNGDFQYTDVGLLDRTHLRFFTRRSMLSLFEDAGFVVVETQTTTIDPLLAPEGPITPAAEDADIVERVQADPDAHVYQFVVRAVPDDEQRLLRDLARRERELEQEVARLRRSAGARLHGRRCGVVQLGLLGNDDDLPARWCTTLLQAEIGRRWPESSVAVVDHADDDVAALRWADALVVLGRQQDAVDPTDLVVPLDLTAGTLAGMDGGQGPTLLGAALHAARLRKTSSGGDRSALLRLLGVVPSEGQFVVVAVAPEEVADLDGLRTVLQRLQDGGNAILTLPLAADGGWPPADVDDVHTLPAWLAAEDVLAVLHDASSVITTHPTVAAMAFALARPHALLAAEGAPATLLATIGGGVAVTAAEIDGVLFRTQALSAEAPKAAAVRARVDDVLDALVTTLTRAVPEAEDAPDRHYVEHLEAAVAALQGRIVSERQRMASAFEVIESERLLDTAGFGTRADLELQLRNLRDAAATYRRALADLQEQLHQATRAVPPPPARSSSRRIVGRVARRLHLR